MPKQIVIAEQRRIAAVFSEDQIQELVVATGQHQVSDIHLGVVENVLPGIDAAFVNLGDTERNGFIHVSDLGPVRLKRSSGAITELLAPQQKVLVQVMKEPTGSKGPRLTGNISLPGRYLVLMPSGKGVNLSRRIRDEDERSRLRALGILIKPAGMGLLVRTEAEGMSEEAIIEDLELLQRQWESIQQQAVSTRAPALLNRDDDFIQRVLRDVYTGDVNRIVVDSSTGLKRVKHYLMSWNGNRLPQGVLVDQHHESGSILEYFRVNAAIREALKPRVDLPSGGYIIIERTEALTVIDVNSGSFTRSATARETVLWTNCEAAAEIARQLRLRNIAGVIIVDFIDMDSRRDQLQLLEHFNKALKADKARPQITQLSELGLVELTRKRQGQNIYELFGRACPTCGGLGHLVHLPGDDIDSPGEMVERIAPMRSYDSAPATTRRVEVGLDAMDAYDLDPSANLQELDLTNHPNYQERGNARRRRRGGGGRRIGENLTPAPRESTPTKVLRQFPGGVVSEPPIGVVDNGLINRKIEKVLPDRTERAERTERPQAEPSRITRPSRTGMPRTREEIPPEIISVTMTPEEQEVYAFMGVSPLVLYSGEVKNPRRAIVKVFEPGEEGAPENGGVKLSAVPTEDLEPAPMESEIEPSIVSNFRTTPIDLTDRENREDRESDTELDDASGSPRRRRRRSSAPSEAEQLSFETSH